MTKILLTYHSYDGQTAKIADRIALRLRSDGAEVDDIDVAHAPPPARYDVVVVGDSIRFQRHSRPLLRYLRRHQLALASVPVALFQVSMMSARSDAAHAAQVEQLASQVSAKTEVQPQVIAAFAGALRYTSYGWVTRRIMRSIARREGNATDTTCDHEYTDWSHVDRFAGAVAALTKVEIGEP